VPAVFVIVLGGMLILGAAVSFIKWGWKTFPFMLSPLVFYALYADKLGALPNLIIPVVLGVAVGIAFRYKLSWQFYVISSSLAIAMIATAGFYYLEKIEQINVFAEWRSQAVMIMKQQKFSKDDIEVWLRNFDSKRAVMRDTFPFTTFAMGLFLSLFSLSIVELFVARVMKQEAVLSAGIERFRMPEPVIFGFIASLAGTLLMPEAYPGLYQTSLNVMAVLAVLYALQGVGIVRYMFVKKGLPPFIFSMGILISILFFGGEILIFMLIIMAGVGALDFWADFRKLNTTTTEDTNEE
jgi:hypothetical protein